MTPTEIAQLLHRYAQSDMTKARKYGSILISQTKRGLVDLEYNRGARTYSLVSQDGGKFQKLNMVAKDCAAAVADLYQVIIERPETYHD